MLKALSAAQTAPVISASGALTQASSSFVFKNPCPILTSFFVLQTIYNFGSFNPEGFFIETVRI